MTCFITFVFRSAGVYFQLALIDHHQNEFIMNSKDIFYHQMSVTTRWYDLEMPKVRSVKEVRIYAIDPLFFNNNGSAVWNRYENMTMVLLE